MTNTFLDPSQGRERRDHGDERRDGPCIRAALDAGTNFIVEMPGSEQALDLANGPIGVGTLVNITVMPGATMEVVDSKA